MAEYAYLTVTSKIKPFFDRILTSGIPSKVNYDYLKSVGFRSSNDRRMVSVLKFLGFIDSSGSPTETWSKYRDLTEAPSVMASAIQTAYHELFRLYPDANRKDDEALMNYFRAQTSLGQRALGGVLGTFKTLCSMANFDSVSTEVVSEETKLDSTPQPKRNHSQHQGTPLTLNVNLQLQLPATENAEIYEKLFSAIKKHLIKADE